MKKIVLISFIASMVVGINVFASDTDRSVKFVFDANPAAFIYMPHLEDFWVDNGYFFEHIDGKTLLAPNANIGANFKISEHTSLEATVGVGRLYSDAIEGSFTTQRLGINFKLGSVVTLGVQAGRISYKNLDWQGDSVVDFSDSKGRLLGLSITAGSELISFHGSIERAKADDVDVTVPPGSSSSSTLDISGTMVNLGVKMMF